ncbi:uncharacterized protein LOC124802641 [Schistocerca piceifrons]|uniref:uncharacterized protein LOC124802641 n=1 Tax=Schistocerca piceifrons TaxID=274613 RepID=UPI001F5EBD0D|nr:uncharacterized protein LOC124802641 [Schistocerca piceifrons]
MLAQSSRQRGPAAPHSMRRRCAQWVWTWLCVWTAAATAMPPPALPGKRDVFVSRGWGAGGMPFSVLYLPAPVLPAGEPQPQSEQPVSQALTFPNGAEEEDDETDIPEIAEQDAGLPQTAAYRAMELRNARELLQQPLSRKHYSVIPQLFVSYGWGPLGK